MNPHGSRWTTLLVAGGTAFFLASGAAAEEPVWQIAKASGDVWITGNGVAQVSLDTASTLKSGDEIRTGRSGRVLLTRGEETILISPNSVVAVPAEKSNEAETVIVQRAGEIVLKVEKKNAPHFEVQTPFLAALVKGTQFRVTIDSVGSKVDVLEGKVQVSDYKSGQFALVLPGQTANVAPTQRGGLNLSGAGMLGPIQHGAPTTPGITRVPVPRHGLAAPKSTASGQNVRAVGDNARKGAFRQDDPMKSAQRDAEARPRNGVIRIAAPIGEVRLDVNKATKGFARAAHATTGANGKSKSAVATVWSSDALSDGNGASKSYGKGNSGSTNGNSSSAKGNGKGNSAAAHAENQGNGNGNGQGKGKGKGNS